MIGNDEWRDLAEFLDSEQVSSFIWVNKKRLKSSWKYRQKLRIQLQRCHYKTVLNLAYNRDFFYDDQIVQWCSSEHKVGVRGELREHWLKIKGDAIYHHLIEETQIQLPIQINGKLKSTINTKKGYNEKDLLEEIYKIEKINSKISEKKIIKVINVQDKIINIITS